MALRVGTAYVDVLPRVGSKFNADVEKSITPGLDESGKKAGGVLGSSVSKAAAVAAGGALAAAGTKFLVGAVDAARESARVAAQSEQVIKSTEGAANITADAMGKLAGSIAAVTGVDDEAIQSAENLLATFTAVRNETGKGNDIFNQATKAIVDMSAVQGTLEGNSVMLGKALQDPIAGLGALSRVGVKFTEEQKEQIRTMAEAGNVAGAQKVILAELGKEFGGQAEAQATAAGKLSVAWGNVQEEIGGKLVPVLENVAGFLAEHTNLILPLAGVIGGVLVVAVAAWTINMAAAAAATLAAAAPVLGILAAVALVAAGIYVLVRNWDDIWRKTREIVGAGVGWVVDKFKGLGSGIANAVGGVASFITAPYKAAFNGIARLWNNTVGKLKFKIPGWVPGIGGKGFDVPNIPTFASGVTNFGGGLAIVGEAGPELVNLPRGSDVVPNHMLGQLGGAGGDTWEVTAIGREAPRETAELTALAVRRDVYLRTGK